MFGTNLQKLMVTVFIIMSIFLPMFVANLVSANGGSIATVNTYPKDGGRYSEVDNFTYQTTAINTNTTVSVCIDNGTLMPMSFKGIINEAANGDAVARNWYTWQASTSAITNPGRHEFQFFSHYEVWQDTDQYWAEFNASSTSQSFTIAGAPSTSATSTKTTPSAPELQPWIITPFVVAMLLSTIIVRKRTPKK
jgi:hypothetical protein